MRRAYIGAVVIVICVGFGVALLRNAHVSKRQGGPVVRSLGEPSKISRYRVVHQAPEKGEIQREFHVSKGEGADLPPKEQRGDLGVAPRSRDDLGEQEDFSVEEIRGMLKAALERDFPGLDLNEGELDELAQAAISIRRSMEALRTLPRGDRSSRMRFREELDAAIASFERITGMSILTFMMKASGEGGIDHD